jgi:hypothetical protein
MADENVPKGKGNRPDYKTPLNACIAGVVAANMGPGATTLIPTEPGEAGFTANDGTKQLEIYVDAGGKLKTDASFRDATFAEQQARIVDGHVVGSTAVKRSNLIGSDGKEVASHAAEAGALVEKATDDVKKCMAAVVPSRKTTPAP